MIPYQRDPVTQVVRYIEPPIKTPAAHEAVTQRQILQPQLARQFLYFTGLPRRLHVCDKKLSSTQALSRQDQARRA
jgi:hypothetical protein